METKLSSMDYWYGLVLGNFLSGQVLTPEQEECYKEQMLQLLQSEVPNVVLMVLERTCNLQCLHCIYQAEQSSLEASLRNEVASIIENVTQQIPALDGKCYTQPARLLHGGRILQKWHFSLWQAIRRLRPELKLGLVDNGRYTQLIADFSKIGFRLDWLDISLDGNEQSHNTQRDPDHHRSYAQTIHGLERAREVVSTQQGGKVAAAFTITKLNYRDIPEVADIVFSENNWHGQKTGNSMPLADELVITFLSPFRESHVEIEIDVNETIIAWEGIKSVAEKYNFFPDGRRRVHVIFDRHQDLEKLAVALGKGKIRLALEDAFGLRNGPYAAETGIHVGGVKMILDGVEVTFHPSSTLTSEVYIIDADGSNRLPHAVQFTLAELETGSSTNGTDTTVYTVEQLTPSSSLHASYARGVRQWWRFFGERFLKEETRLFREIFR